MSHPVLDASLHRRNVPLRLRAASLRELVGASLFVRVQDAISPPVTLGKGGRQGGTETPTEWNFLLDHALHDTVLCWLKRRYGWDPGDGLPPISHVAWADDLFWFSPCFAQFASMCQDLTTALEDVQLTWKPSSLLFMPNRVAAQDLPETWCSSFSCLEPLGGADLVSPFGHPPLSRRPPLPYGRHGYGSRPQDDRWYAPLPRPLPPAYLQGRS